MVVSQIFCLYRETELETEYVTARPAKALQLWYSYEPNEHESFAKWLALYLGKVARLVSEEQDNTTFLFGHSKGTKVLSSIIKEATNPLQSSLCDRLSNFSTPEIPFDCYCVTDEFSRRVFAMLNDLDEQQYGDVLRSIYGGFYQFLESYGNCEEFYIRNHLQEILDNVSFEGGESLLEDRQKDNFLASDDSSDCYSMFGERAIAATDSFQVPVEFCIKRCISFMGGLRVKPVMRMLGTVLALFVRLLTAKVDELSVACGFARELSPIPQISTGSSAMPQSVADSLALKLETNDVDSRLLIMSALRALQAAGRFSRNFKVLEQFTKNTMIELDSTLFRKSSLTSFVLESRNNNRSLGQAYASFLQENDTSISSELKSFLIASSSTSQHLAQSVFSAVYTPLAKFKSMAGTLLFNLCIEAPDKMIAGLSNETVWQLQSSDGDSTATDLKESMLPQSVVTQVSILLV